MKKKVIVLFALLFSFIGMVNAEETEDTEPVLTIGASDVSSEVVPETVLYADDNIDVDGEQNSSQFVFGNTVKAKSNIFGLSVIAGNTLDIEGSAEYGAYAGNILTINSVIEKDLFAAGSTINIGSKAVIGRDAYIAASAVKINANVARDLRVAGSSVDISGITINGDAYLETSEIIMDENTVIAGKLLYIKDTNIKGLDLASVGSTEIKDASEFGKVEINFGATLYSSIISAVAGIIVAIVLFYMIPSIKKKLDDVNLEIGSIIGNFGKGLGVIIIIPIVSIVAAITGILTPLGLITLALYIIGIYLASILSGYIIGRTIMTKAFKNDNQYLSIVVGILLIRLLGLVPVLGGVVTSLCLLYGLGLLYNFAKKQK